MELKNIKELSNSELGLYKKELENYYEVLKTKISKYFHQINLWNNKDQTTENNKRRTSATKLEVHFL